MSSGPSRHPRERFEEFIRHILAVPKAELDARLDAEKRAKRVPKRPPPN